MSASTHPFDPNCPVCRTEILGKLTLQPLDFEKIDKHGKIGDELVLVPNKQFVCLIDGRLHLGSFSPVWFGLNFYSDYNRQFDPYRTNCTGYQAIWEVVGGDEIAEALEPSYAEWQKKYCVSHGITRGGKPITNETPIESFWYFSNRPVEIESDEDDTD